MVRAELVMAIILPDTGEGKERNSAEKSPAGPIGILAVRGDRWKMGGTRW
jgi:hypothetical protein